MIVVVLPKEPTAIHLDMIFNQMDRERCLVYPPHFVGPERLAVLHRRKGEAGMRETPNLFAALAAVDLPLEPVFCGGARRADQEREQWGSACNVVVGAPGRPGRVRAQRGDVGRDGEGRLPDRAGREAAQGGAGRGRRREGGDRHPGERAGARRRRAALHDDAAPAGRPVITLAERASAFLKDGPRPPLEICHDVLGLPQASRTVAERLVLALLGADPRFAFDVDGRWGAVVEPGLGAVPLSDLRFAVVDVETTGMSARHGDRMTEVAVVHVDGDGAPAEVAFESLLNPGVPIPPRITMLTGIDDALVRDAPRFEDVADNVLAALSGRIFVAHNVRFDWAFVRAEVERACGVAPRVQRLCTVRLSRALVPELERRDLDTVRCLLRHRDRPAAPRRRRRPGDRGGAPAAPRPRRGPGHPDVAHPQAPRPMTPAGQPRARHALHRRPLHLLDAGRRPPVARRRRDVRRRPAPAVGAADPARRAQPDPPARCAAC